MKVGTYFDLRNPTNWRQDSTRLYGFTLEMCEEAERLGLSSVWLTEHHLVPDGYLPQPLTFAAAVAARTRRLRIGTGILLAPLRRPIHIAEEAAVVDIISEGRLDLGLGAGYSPQEFEAYGVDIRRRYSLTDDCARELRRLWGEEIVTPAPVQRQIPLWMGYMGPRSARRAGLLGENLLAVAPELYTPYREGLIEGGHDPGRARMAGGLQGWISEDPDRDWPVVARHLKYQMESYRDIASTGGSYKPIDPERLRAHGLANGLGGFLFATPEDAAREIKTYLVGLPVDTIYMFASLANTPEDLTARHIQAIARLGELLA